MIERYMKITTGLLLKISITIFLILKHMNISFCLSLALVSPIGPLLPTRSLVCCYSITRAERKSLVVSWIHPKMALIISGYLRKKKMPKSEGFSMSEQNLEQLYYKLSDAIAKLDLDATISCVCFLHLHNTIRL